MLVWVGIRLEENSDTGADYTTEDGVEMTKDEQVVTLVMSCPFMQDSDTDFFDYKLPVFILLLVNSFFLVWIMVVSSNIGSPNNIDDVVVFRLL